MNKENEDTEKIFFEEKNANNNVNKFNLIIGISTLLIAILGATFAYFSATARDENVISVKSAYISISYDGGTEIIANNLIPATQTVALTEYQKRQTLLDDEATDEDKVALKDYDVYETKNKDRKCVDARGKEVCYVYQFTVESNSDSEADTDIVGYVNVSKNEFTNLSYILYEVEIEENGNGEIIKDKYGFDFIKRDDDGSTEFSILDTIPGYTLLETNQYFDNIDTNPDNENYVDGTLQFPRFKFGKFEQPAYDILEDNTLDTGTILEPVACLFGYKEGYKDLKINDPSRCRSFTLKGKDTKVHHYQLVIWLEETGKVQNEQAKEFKGNIVLEATGGNSDSSYTDGKITGKID